MTNRPAAIACSGIVITALAVFLNGCGAPDSAGGSSAAATPAVAADGKTVEVNHMSFTPETLTVRVGDTVTWKFDDRFAHSVQGLSGNDSKMSSPIYDKGGVWTYRFTAAGAYDYTCPLHTDMRGRVIVR